MQIHSEVWEKKTRISNSQSGTVEANRTSLLNESIEAAINI